MENTNKLGFATKLIHVGSRVDEAMLTRPKVLPIYQTSVFALDGLEQLDQKLAGDENIYTYTRHGNPNQTALEQLVAQLEEGEASQTCSSGMAAIMAAILAEVNAGEHIIATRDIYGGTKSLLVAELARFDIATTFVDTTHIHNVEKAIQSNTKLVYSETVSNPLLKITDVAKLREITKAYGFKLIIDNTFATPYLFQPLLHGADAVIHSTTKYINGHSDTTGGIVVGAKEFIGRVKRVTLNFGSSSSPFESWLTYRGAKTLALRMAQHCRNASDLANFLSNNPAVSNVYYPGLTSHPDNQLATELFKKGYGGMLSFELKGSLIEVDKFIKALQYVLLAPSLAGIATTISHPTKTSHVGLGKAELAELGLTDQVIRVSVGIEDIEDIIHDFAQALAISQTSDLQYRK